VKNCPTLYSFRRCPYAIRARLALAYSSIEVELREVKLNRLPPSMLALSPKGTVPVLNLGDSMVLEESLHIIDWALSRHDPENWMRSNDDLIVENDESFKPVLDRYKYADRYPEKSQQEYRDLAIPFLRKLDGQLQNSVYLFDDRISKVDIAILPFVRQFAGVEPDWFANCEFDYLRDWLQVFLKSTLFQTIMPRFAVWQPGDEAVYL